MLETLVRVCDHGGLLVGVSGTLFDGERPFITAVALRFEHLTAVFRADPDDDTLAASVDPVAAGPGEVVTDLCGVAPWPGCLGLGVCWAWRLTNQHGYTDGVRLEFSEPGGPSRAVVELVAVASGIRVFEAAEVRQTRRGT